MSTSSAGCIPCKKPLELYYSSSQLEQRTVPWSKRVNVETHLGFWPSESLSLVNCQAGVIWNISLGNPIRLHGSDGYRAQNSKGCNPKSLWSQVLPFSLVHFATLRITVQVNWCKARLLGATVQTLDGLAYDRCNLISTSKNQLLHCFKVSETNLRASTVILELICQSFFAFIAKPTTEQESKENGPSPKLKLNSCQVVTCSQGRLSVVCLTGSLCGPNHVFLDSFLTEPVSPKTGYAALVPWVLQQFHEQLPSETYFFTV